MNASISVVCYKSKKLSNGQHPLMLQISRYGKRKYQSLGISIHPDNWDFLKCKITKKIKECGILSDIAVLDHIIIGDDRYYSYADDGTL